MWARVVDLALYDDDVYRNEQSLLQYTHIIIMSYSAAVLYTVVVAAVDAPRQMQMNVSARAYI